MGIQATETPDSLNPGAKFMAKQILDYSKPVYVLVWGMYIGGVQ